MPKRSNSACHFNTPTASIQCADWSVGATGPGFSSHQIKKKVEEAESMLIKYHNGDTTAKEAWNNSIEKLNKRYADAEEYASTAHCILMELRATFASAEAALR